MRSFFRRRVAPLAGRSVVVYTTPRCHLCEEARDVLARLGVAHTVVDASGDAHRRERTPVVEVDGVEIADATVRVDRLAERLLRAP